MGSRKNAVYHKSNGVIHLDSIVQDFNNSSALAVE